MKGEFDHNRHFISISGEQDLERERRAKIAGDILEHRHLIDMNCPSSPSI